MTTPFLSTAPLFAPLSEIEQAELVGLMQTRTVPAGTVVFWVGDAGDSFMVVAEGHVEVTCPDETGKEVLLATLAAGEFFGELSLLDGGPRTATARARDTVSLLTLDRPPFLEFLRRHPDAAIHMLTVLGRRQRETLASLRGIRNLNEAVELAQTRWQVVSDRVASAVSTGGFVAFNVVFVIVWIAANLALRSRNLAFDGSHFDLLGFLFSIESLLVTLFVLINQNRQSGRDRLRADLDYQVSLKAHLELTRLHQKVDAMTAARAEEAAWRAGLN
jgi:CRP/FNR family cyclic AMP-dependent transcriptional regulator